MYTTVKLDNTVLTPDQEGQLVEETKVKYSQENNINPENVIVEIKNTNVTAKLSILGDKVNNDDK